MTIKQIIFDLGNVIVDIDSTRMLRQFSELGIAQGADIFTVETQNELCDRFECGLISPDEFMQALSAFSTHDLVDRRELQRAWESMILQSHPQRLQIIRAARERYRVFLLSNTNSIHYDYINTLFVEHYEIACLDDLFDKAYYSFKLGLRKPSRDIFLHVLQDQNMNPEETLFIDDLEKNIQTAQQLQIQTWHAQDLKATWDYVASLVCSADPPPPQDVKKYS